MSERRATNRVTLGLAAIAGIAAVAAWLVLFDAPERSSDRGRSTQVDTVVTTEHGPGTGAAPELVEIPQRSDAARSDAPRSRVDVPSAPRPRTVAPGAPIVTSAAATPPPPSPSRSARVARRRAADRPALRADDAAESAVRGLVRHQADDGRWDADAFDARDDERAPDGARGDAGADLRVTCLALLALIEDGHTLTDGRFKGSVERATKWIVAQQEQESGRIGTREGLDGSLDHAFATFALGELVAHGAPQRIRSRRALAAESLATAAAEFAPQVAAATRTEPESAAEAWNDTVVRLAVYSHASTRREMRVEGANTLGWRHALHATFGTGSGANDVFAGFTHESLRRSSDGNVERWTNELLAGQIVETESGGAFDSTDSRHASIGRVGVTALHVICLAIVADRLDETHDRERWNR